MPEILQFATLLCWAWSLFCGVMTAYGLIRLSMAREFEIMIWIPFVVMTVIMGLPSTIWLLVIYHQI